MLASTAHPSSALNPSASHAIASALNTPRIAQARAKGARGAVALEGPDELPRAGRRDVERVSLLRERDGDVGVAGEAGAGGESLGELAHGRSGGEDVLRR